MFEPARIGSAQLPVSHGQGMFEIARNFINKTIAPAVSNDGAAVTTSLIGSPSGGLTGAVAFGVGWGLAQAAGDAPFSTLTGPPAVPVAGLYSGK